MYSSQFKCAQNLHSDTINADLMEKNGNNNNGIMPEGKVCVCVCMCWGVGGGGGMSSFSVAEHQ